MIGYVSVDEQVDKDFYRALTRASLRRWKDRLLRKCARERLLSFDEAKDALVGWSQAYRGIRTVEVEKITGSVGRYRDFDESFLPLKASMSDRWSRIDRAYHRGDELPLVSLYKIGDAYFVRDGNHRVSVARYHGGDYRAKAHRRRGKSASKRRQQRGQPNHPRQPPSGSHDRVSGPSLSGLGKLARRAGRRGGRC
jgi:hypothetical protein